MPETWQGAGAPAVPPKIDAWQINTCADRLHKLSESLKSNPDQSSAKIAGELEGLGMRLKHLVKHALLAAALLIVTSDRPVVAGHTPYPHPPPCAKGAEISQHLSKKYQEEAVAFGLQADGKLLQIYSSEGGVTWTAVTLDPRGMACIVAAGKHFEVVRAFEEQT